MAGGFYTIREAAQLIEVGSQRRIAGWLKGYSDRRAGPLLKRSYAPLGESQELSFVDLIEVRFVETFREQGVKMSTLRRALQTARDVFGTDRPFATDKIRFKTDGKDVLVEEILKPTAKKEGDSRLWSLTTRQYNIYEVVIATLVGHVTFDASSHLARRWVPRPERYPNIIIDPRIAYGKPTTACGQATETIYDAWLAEDKTRDAVSHWYEVPRTEVEEALGFERLIRGEEVMQPA